MLADNQNDNNTEKKKRDDSLNRSVDSIHSDYLRKMSDYLQSPERKKSAREAYFDVKKELDVARIENLIEEAEHAASAIK